jgi:hypothetical protein
MHSMRARWLGLLLLAGSAACSSPTEPALVPAGYAGEWAGTTGQGTPVTFSVSGDQVTSFTLAFRFSFECSGTVTLPGPRAIVMQVPPGPPPYDQPGFVVGVVGTQAENSEWGVAVAGHFSPDRRSASGEFKLVQYPGCDTVMSGTWTTQRR